jgi:hypothetical protein
MTMLTTNLLFAVPEAVARQILVEWLGLKDVARTDSAFCTWKTRADFLSLAYDNSVVYDRRRGGSIFSFESCAPWCISFCTSFCNIADKGFASSESVAGPFSYFARATVNGAKHAGG